MLANFYQIYFDQQSKANCFNEWNLYDNSEKLTEFFENSVIINLINKKEHKKAKYFGVFSHDIKKHVLFKEGKRPFTPENLKIVMEENPHIDVFAFERRRKQTNIIYQADNYHNGFIDMINIILKKTQFLSEIPKKLPNIVLYNHFIARSEIYERYVNELLRPAMAILKSMPQAYKDAKYKRVTPDTMNRFQSAFGLNYYTFHPFICERLPSLFLAKYNYSFKHIF